MYLNLTSTPKIAPKGKKIAPKGPKKCERGPKYGCFKNKRWGCTSKTKVDCLYRNVTKTVGCRPACRADVSARFSDNAPNSQLD